MNAIDLITHSLNVTVAESVEDAPNYTEQTKMLRMTDAIIVKHGTQEGNPTVDLQMVDAEGNHHLVMITGKLLEVLGRSIEAAREES